jgi:hypothetical protein
MTWGWGWGRSATKGVDMSVDTARKSACATSKSAWATLAGAALLISLIYMTACGYIGPPQPPSLDIPQRVGDLVVAEYGSNILVEFSIGPLTTEGLPLKSLRSVNLYIGIAPEPYNENAWLASAKRFPITVTGPGPVSYQAPATEWIGKDVVIGVRATGPKGKTSDLSNIKNLPVQAPLAAPVEVKAVNTIKGVYLTWKSPVKKSRIFRAVADAQPELLAENAVDTNWLDETVEFGTEYRYFVQAVAGEYQQSETAPSQVITRTDDFAPAVPTGLNGQPGASSIELSWDRNTDPRFQGYNVYRAVEGGAFEKVASVIVAPAYSDRMIESGKKYRYMVSAVGTNGMESEKSAEIEVAAQ